MTREQRQRTAMRGTVMEVVKAASMSPMSGVAERVNRARVSGLWIVRQCEAPMRAHRQHGRSPSGVTEMIGLADGEPKNEQERESEERSVPAQARSLKPDEDSTSRTAAESERR